MASMMKVTVRFILSHTIRRQLLRSFLSHLSTMHRQGGGDTVIKQRWYQPASAYIKLCLNPLVI